MKKLVSVCLALCLVLVPVLALSACDVNGQPPSSVVDQTPIDPSSSLPGELSGVLDMGSDPVPTVSAPVLPSTQAIQFSIEALVLAMTEQEMDYDAASDSFIWTALYYSLSLHSGKDARATMTDDALYFPAEAAADYLAALTTDLEQLPQLPAELAERVTYLAEKDCYVLQAGNFGLTEAVLCELQPLGDGTYSMDGALIYPPDESVICSFQVILTQANTPFHFAVENVTVF